MRAMPKHSFNADEAAESILSLVERALRDKTEFLNRLIILHGRLTIETIMQERQQALADTPALHDQSTQQGHAHHTKPANPISYRTRRPRPKA